MKSFYSILMAFIGTITVMAQNSINGHEYVDFNLPSGNLWATCNIGSTAPEKVGDYFAWAETEPKEAYGWPNWKYRGTNYYSGVLKYNLLDNLKQLQPQDDVARVKWTGGWHIPSVADYNELREHANFEKAQLNGVEGFKIVSKSDPGKYIFLPVSGHYAGSIDVTSELTKADEGHYWLSNNYSGVQANFIHFKDYCYIDYICMYYYGKQVRPVYTPPSTPGVIINDTNFPDETFRSYVGNKTIDVDQDGILYNWETEGVTSIYFSGKEVTSLKGIEHFTELQRLSCSNNKLQELDITKNTKLKYLYCGENELTQLDVTQNVELGLLECPDNQLSQIDVSKNTKLYGLYCAQNKLTSLNLSQNTDLEDLSVFFNQLTVLDLSANTKLQESYVSLDPQEVTLPAVKLSDGRIGVDLGGGSLDGVRFTDFKADGVEGAATVSGKYLIVANDIASCPDKVIYNYDTKYNSVKMYVAINIEKTGLSTGILEIVNENGTTVTPYYNLSGQRVGNGYKGIVIVNGKKHVVNK